MTRARQTAALLALVVLPACDAAVETAKSEVRKHLDDPDSARFSEVRSCTRPKMIIGKVNAKNRFGGYTGDEMFFVVDGRVYLPGTIPLVYDEPYVQRFMIGLIAACEGMDYETDFTAFLNSYDFRNDTEADVREFNPFRAPDAPAGGLPRRATGGPAASPSNGPQR
ncbi:hypothetical protein ACFQ1E_17310 [Sphingomonas canadensis]|uniref:Uncharacterized protein n=1 Tax=Sphingomonas canadensis TaxID=1219257 RepID=A0ABW3HCH1_9SPHN|nr:hypothetical protein [Sphingomonas canadensis]MCW3837806.1 hypothetical protein [Sphingomonas canadensis]